MIGVMMIGQTMYLLDYNDIDSFAFKEFKSIRELAEYLEISHQGIGLRLKQEKRPLIYNIDRYGLKKRYFISDDWVDFVDL